MLIVFDYLNKNYLLILDTGFYLPTKEWLFKKAMQAMIYCVSRLIGSRIIESVAYYNQIFLAT